MLAREIIRRVREIQVRTGRQVADVLAGEYVSVFKGRGMEFDEVRPYIPGDDVRTIDWNVTARMGEPFVKRFVEERQLTIHIIADVSGSQDFGSGERSKREATAELCALLAFSAIQNDDKVGLTLFHRDIERFIPARKGQKHALRVVREVIAYGQEPVDVDRAKRVESRGRFRRFFGRRRRTSGAGTNIERALEFVTGVHKRRSVAFVVSDFIDDGYERAMRAANRKHDVVAVIMTDPRETSMVPAGLVTLEDAESGKRALVDTGSPAFRDAFESTNRERLDTLEKRFRSAGIDVIQIDASGSIVEPLVQFFKMRERRSRR